MLHAHFAQVLETDQRQDSCQANLILSSLLL